MDAWVWGILVLSLSAALYLLLIEIDSFIGRRAGRRHLTTASSPQTSFNSLLPSPVLSLSAETDGRDASVTLKWTHPTENWSQVRGYEIQYKKLSIQYNSSFKLRTIPHHCETYTLTRDDGIEPLNEYLIEIRPTSGHEGLYTEWTSTVVFISECTNASIPRSKRPIHAVVLMILWTLLDISVKVYLQGLNPIKVSTLYSPLKW